METVPDLDNQAPSLDIQRIHLSALRLNPNNTQINHDIDQLAESLEIHGQFKPIVVWHGMVMCGNGTFQAARKLGWRYIQCNVLPDDMPQEQAQAIALIDNRTFSDPDEEQIALILQSLPDDLPTGYSDEEYKELLARLGGDESEGESKDAEPVTQTEADKAREIYQTELGQVWKLGRHKIACIDSLDIDKISNFLGDTQVDCLWADPPYGIDIVAPNGYVGGGEAYSIPFGGVKNRAKGLGSPNAAKPFGSKKNRVVGSDRADNIVKVGKYAPVAGDSDLETAIDSSSLYVNKYPDAFHLWWGGNYYANNLPASSCWIVWDKQNTGNFADVEIAWTNHKGSSRLFSHMWNGMLKESEQGIRRVHPTQKPIALARWAFEKYGNPNDVIFDPFLGSGISVLAAEQLNDGRCVFGCELAPEYIAITIQRWEELTGEKATLI